MTATRYVFAYDRAAASCTDEAMIAFIRSNRYILQWASVFPGVYLIKSDSSTDDIWDSLNAFLGSAQFIICKITSTHKDSWNGRLPTAVWKWFSLLNEDDSEVLKLD